LIVAGNSEEDDRLPEQYACCLGVDFDWADLRAYGDLGEIGTASLCAHVSETRCNCDDENVAVAWGGDGT